MFSTATIHNITARGCVFDIYISFLLVCGGVCCYNVPVPKDFVMNQHQYNVFLGLALFVLFTPIVWFIWFVFFRKHK